MAEAMLARAARLVPALGTRKGLSGRVAVIGGSEEYTGAPFLAGMSALRIGADLVHVLCPPSAAVAIKSYSPDLVVHPLLTKSAIAERQEEFDGLLGRMHAVVMGPGLGRQQESRDLCVQIFEKLRALRIPTVLDADALFFVSRDLDQFSGHPGLVMTPNPMELERLLESAKIVQSGDRTADLRALSERLRGPAASGPLIVAKGEQDVLVSTAEAYTITHAGSPRRVGGQGDVLCGSIGAFLAFARVKERGTESAVGDHIAGAAAACVLTKKASELAFAQYRRGMVASDMLPLLPRAFDLILEPLI